MAKLILTLFFEAGQSHIAKNGCHPGRARSAKIRDRGVNACASGGPGSALRLSGMTALFAENPDAIALLFEGAPVVDLHDPLGHCYRHRAAG